MHFDLLIRGGQLASSSAVRPGDIGIVDGLVAAIGDLRASSADSIVDATGLIAMAGVIDTQVHFREPGMENKEDIESGTRAAILGGITTIFEMPNTLPPTTSQAALEDKLRRAKGRAWCDYGFFVGASTENIDQLAELETLPGTPGIKMFHGSSTGSLLVESESDLRRVLLSGKKRVPVHSEDEQRNRERKAMLGPNPHVREHPWVRDAESARLSTERVLQISGETGRPVHILHVSTADELPLIAEAKRNGLGTTAEITPQHLFFCAPDCYERLGTLAQMNPPVRSAEHQMALRTALKEGLFDIVGSDHAPHTLAEKALPYPQSPSGMPGVQTLLPVMLNFVNEGLLPLTQLVALSSENPARLYGIKNKGRIEPGFDADLVLIDLDKRQVFDRSMVASKCGWSPFEGVELRGWPVHVFLRGARMVEDGKVLGGPLGRVVEFL